MKSIIHFALCFLLSFASAAPIVILHKEPCNLHGLCHATTMKTSVTSMFSVSYLKLSPYKIAPHIPELENSIEEASKTTSTVSVDNTPDYSRLSENGPLESTYLQSLQFHREEKKLAVPDPQTSANDASTATGPLPSAPTAALPLLRAEDARKLELSLLHPSRLKKSSNCGNHVQLSANTIKLQKELIFLRDKLSKSLLTETSSASPQEINLYFTKLEGAFPTATLSSIKKTSINQLLEQLANKTHMRHNEEFQFSARSRKMLHKFDRMDDAEHRKQAVQGDVIVVGFVVVFILAVILIELADHIFCSIKSYLGIVGEGAIRLPDDDELVDQAKPFRLMPAPKGRKYSLEKISEEV